MKPRIRRQPSQRDSRNLCAFYGGETVMEQPKKRAVARGKQPESASNDAVKGWANIRRGVLYRNRRGMVDLPSGGKMPYGLGPNGYGDNVGYLPVVITADMVGRTLAVYTMVECKRADQALKDPEAYGDQFKYVEEVRAAGGIAGFARHAEDSEAIYQRWLRG